jgi:NAD(P)-dependent dehydrogenase (short-subunit alcohol dehydrogenase family)
MTGPAADGEVAGRGVLVTGAASGIGRATALSLANRGARVVAIDIDEGAIAHLQEEVRASGGELHAIRADVSRDADVAVAVEQAAARLGGIDVLVHAAGIMAGQLEDIGRHTEATWDRVIDVNLKGAFLLARHVSQVMLPAGRGVILLLASKAGVTVGSGSFSYGASKGGIHGLAMTLERHLGPRGIRVNDVCPGDIDTPLMHRSLDEALANGGDPAEIARIRSHLTPPESVAELLVFLASDRAAAVRGTVFTS